MSETIQGTGSADALESVRATARTIARHLNHDHPPSSAKRKQCTVNIRRRTRLHMVPRLWHWRQLYAHYLELYRPLWLGEDGVIYREYQDLFGNAYFMEAEIWKRDAEGLRRIQLAVWRLDPCVVTVTA